MILDQNVRDAILESNHSHYLISASAGSGKTTILVKKAFSMIEKRLFRPYQKVAMITFTRLATRQLKNKVTDLLVKDYSNNNNYMKMIKISTTESFVLSEVIKPFIRDAFGKDFPIGDSLVQNYNYNFSEFKYGLLKIETQGVIGSYRDNKKNFTYELGLQVLKNSSNAQKYFKAQFPVIMVDEYQDVDLDMHNFYMFLKDELKVRLFLVGDIKQMLYGFRGAHREIMSNLFNNDELHSYQLIHNFRSHISIVNYSYLFLKKELNLQHIPHEENKVRIYSDINLSANINKFINEKSLEDDTFVYLVARRSQWRNEKHFWEEKGFVFIDRTPLDSSFPNYDVLEPVLKLYFDSSRYNIYNMLDDLDVEINESTLHKAKLIHENFGVDIPKVLKLIEDISGKNLLKEEKENFLKTLEDKYSVNYVSERPKRLVMTIHSAKGLDFDHIFVNADSFYYYGDFQKQNHYVAITRPRNSLHIVKNERYESLLHDLDINILDFKN